MACGSEISTNDRQSQKISALALHLLQVCLVYVNTLMIQRVLAEPHWWNLMKPEDFRALSPLIYAHRCDNIDFSKPMKLTPYSVPREDNPKKSNQMLVAYQEGTKIEKVKFAEVGPEGTHAPYLDEDEGKWMFGKRSCARRTS